MASAIWCICEVPIVGRFDGALLAPKGAQRVDITALYRERPDHVVRSFGAGNCGFNIAVVCSQELALGRCEKGGCCDFHLQHASKDSPLRQALMGEIVAMGSLLAK